MVKAGLLKPQSLVDLRDLVKAVLALIPDVIDED